MNAQQNAAANQRLMFSSNNIPSFSTSSDNIFRSDCENPSKNHFLFEIFFYKYCIIYLDDLLNDNTNMSTISLSSMLHYLILAVIKRYTFILVL